MTQLCAIMLRANFSLEFSHRYSKLEFQQARSLWMAGMRHLGDVEATEADYETQFSVMVEQEVERRLFQVSFLFSYFVELLIAEVSCCPKNLSRILVGILPIL